MATSKRKSAPIIHLKSARGKANIIDAVLGAKPARGRPPGGSQRKTVADRLKAVMGRRQMNARQLAEAAVVAGEEFDTTNLVALVASALIQSTTRVNGADGTPLRGKNGELVKVRVFTSTTTKGVYRVATPEDMQKEALAILDVTSTNKVPTRLQHGNGKMDIPSVRAIVASNGDVIRDVLIEAIRDELQIILRGDELKAILKAEVRSLLRGFGKDS